jgi:hypothetical protein
MTCAYCTPQAAANSFTALQPVLPRGSPRAHGVPAEPAAQLTGPFTRGEALFQNRSPVHSGLSHRTQNTPICGLEVEYRGAPSATQNGGSARGYLAVGGPVSSSGIAYWMIACSVYLYIANLGANVRICRIVRVSSQA